MYRFRLALIDDEALDRSRRYLDGFGIATTTFAFAAPTPKHSAMTAIRSSRQSAHAAVTSLIEWPTTASDAWRKGFLAGIFDAEGSHSHGVLRICNTDDEIIDTHLARR